MKNKDACILYKIRVVLIRVINGDVMKGRVISCDIIRPLKLLHSLPIISTIDCCLWVN